MLWLRNTHFVDFMSLKWFFRLSYVRSLSAVRLFNIVGHPPLILKEYMCPCLQTYYSMHSPPGWNIGWFSALWTVKFSSRFAHFEKVSWTKVLALKISLKEFWKGSYSTSHLCAIFSLDAHTLCANFGLNVHMCSKWHKIDCFCISVKILPLKAISYTARARVSNTTIIGVFYAQSEVRLGKTLTGKCIWSSESEMKCHIGTRKLQDFNTWVLCSLEWAVCRAAQLSLWVFLDF